MSEEKLSFQAEVSRLLDIVAHSLYSNKEIFLRELISNASDACDRLRYAALTQPELTADDPDFKIDLTLDTDAKTLTIADNGIGMNREDLVENLGTIARSGTAAFMDQLDSKQDGTNLIGQFGVGFYSSYMVADKVSVISRRAGEDQAWSWVSDGRGEFTIGEAEDAPKRGTRITLHLREDQAEFADPMRLRTIVKTYSDHIPIPISLREGDKEPESLNTASAIWTRPKSEITDAQYTEFYHHVAHAFDEPWERMHFKAEGMIEYTGLLFIPASKPFDLFHPDRKHGVKLYVRRVFITDDCAELIPPYLRFLRGVIDTEDLPLNISREMLQHNPLLTKIRNGVAKRVVSELTKKAEKDPEAFEKFWNDFGAVLKEGIYEDDGQRAALLKLARFRSTTAEGMTTLADYVSRMKEGQDAIYYISGADGENIKRSPQLEGFAAKGVEVLLFSDPVDEFWITSIPDFEGKAFKSVTRGGADLGKIGGAEKDEKEGEEETGSGDTNVDSLIAFVKLTLKEQVKDVRASERLTESAVCLVADEGDIDINLERILKQHNQLDSSAQRVLEINPKHSLVKALAKRIGQEGAGDELQDAAGLLLDQARILEGETLPDPVAFARRLSGLVEKGLA
ncbi:molecular chaperone HtpG [Denitrobaculum tricleocarpae]|uniref:Chaperone protein HtpG n=1 Tax=Denitrobaculum tricleocarpae TaxID=2591009 RepID=A0A545TQZ9_9PROT|nr:molecular chaperone HtpG [Denitrobaculum tricleocarpae]TQV79644.1 molecular chaperone HtpG [Denitrobaculum tricleocarpae]